jgi:transposase
MNKLRTTGLLIDKKQKHKHRVLTEEKLDAIGTRLEHTPRKSLKHLAEKTGTSFSNTVAEAVQ